MYVVPSSLARLGNSPSLREAIRIHVFLCSAYPSRVADIPPQIAQILSFVLKRNHSVKAKALSIHSSLPSAGLFSV